MPYRTYSTASRLRGYSLSSSITRHRHPFRKPGSLHHVAKTVQDLRPGSKRKASAHTSTMGTAFVRQAWARLVLDSILWKIIMAARTSGWFVLGTMSKLSGRIASVDFKRLEALWWPLIAFPFTFHSSVACQAAEEQLVGESKETPRIPARYPATRCSSRSMLVIYQSRILLT